MDTTLDIFLIAEENPAEADKLRCILKKQNYRVAVARDGNEALDFIKRKKPGILISAVNMPGMNGYELCEKIKSDENLKDIYIILLTALSDPADVMRGLECGADTFIPKPYDSEFLLSRIKHFLLNKEVREKPAAEDAIKIFSRDKDYLIKVKPFQILDFLLSTYESAVIKNKQIEKANEELTSVKHELEMQNLQLMATRKKLDESYIHNTLLYDVAPVHYLTLDEEGIIQEINLTGARLFGINLSESAGTPFKNFLDEHHLKSFSEHLSQCKKTDGKVITDVLLRAKDGKKIYGQLVSIRKGYFYHTAIHDITDRVKEEEERNKFLKIIASNVQELTVANEELEKSAKLKDGFLASMSHELRTPLNAILGMSEALLEEIFGPLNEKQKTYLKTIEESGRHLLSLINDILDLSKIEAGKLEVETGVVVIESLCQACLRLIKQSAHMKRIKVFTNIDNEILEIETDERKLKQIIVNLLSNAVKFTHDGGEIGLEVKLDKERNMINFIVWDRGIGISQEDTDRLFLPFVQLDSSLSRQYSGTGLGLALVRSLTELLDGIVSLKSEIGKGSSFTVSIPWKKTVKKDFLKKALIIEDSRPYSNLIAHFLKRENIKSIIHPLGYRALEKALEVSPDLIILDIMLPDLSGWDVLEQLKASDSTKDIPVIIISAIDDHSRGLSMGAAEYMIKPVSYDQFIQSVKKVLLLKDEFLSSISVELEDKKQKVILIAEDNKENIMLYSDYIGAKGYKIITACNGKKAIDLVKEKEPDLILMDIQMPEMDGIEAIRHIRKMEQNTHIPIIALTSLAMVGDREKCLSAGADDYAAKPVNLKRLMEMIEKCLSRGEKE